MNSKLNYQVAGMNDIYSEKILILDFGSQYTQLIARGVREAHIYSEIHAFDMADEAIKAFDPSAIILSGGPESVTAATKIVASQIIFELGVPILGICYGMQTMSLQLGGQVATGGGREFGYEQIRARGHSALLKGIQDSSDDHGHGLLDVWMSHGDQVTKLPEGFKVIASTENTSIAGMADETRKFYGVQFHPEVTHTKQGKAILKRFLRDIAGCQGLWQIRDIAEHIIRDIRATVGKEHVLLALSGGVDSSVVAALLDKAIGEQLTCVFVDNGMLRKDEGDQIMATFTGNMDIKIIRADAEQHFLNALKGISDPEQKREIIGNSFITIFQQQAAQITECNNNIKWLAQGTIYPDVIESAGGATGKAHNIKTHHNVGGLPEDMPFKLIEPLRALFKDEVRQLGSQIGVLDSLIKRHPFPGPGLAVRILGEVRQEYLEMLRQADAIYIEELQRWQLYDRVSQAFAVFLPVRSVAVMGDTRRYEHVIALRAVETVDFMTACWAHLPYDFLDRVARRICNEINGISRVVYDISGKPPATIEWE